MYDRQIKIGLATASSSTVIGAFVFWYWQNRDFYEFWDEDLMQERTFEGFNSLEYDPSTVWAA